MMKLNRSFQPTDQQRRIATEFLSGSYPRILFGCNEHSAELADHFDVASFVDDYRHDRTFHGKPVITSKDIPGEAVVVNCVLSIKPWTAKKRAESISSKVIDYGTLHALADERVPLPSFGQETLSDLTHNAESWCALRAKLGDNYSRQVLDDVLNFRTTARPEFLSSYKFAPEEQYFDPIVKLEERPVFVDCGGFDGDTTEQFVRRFSEYQEVHFFEPSAPNMDAAKTRLAGNHNITYHALGVSNEAGELRFDSEGGSSSAISPTGSNTIRVTTLDEVLAGKVSMIKMDLEGWEIAALQGAKQLIAAQAPVLAIAVYHRPSDFWTIPGHVFEWQSNYDIYLRHYTEGWSETVMYFIPKTDSNLI
jgi:FkbM family methyltransferase